MNSSSVPSIEGDGKRGVLPLRPWLVGLSAPMPTIEAPSTLRLAGYRVSALQGDPLRQGRELSHGELRRFRLEPLSGGPPLVLSLLPLRSRTGTELSEPSKELKGLNMVAVGAEVVNFALNDRRLLSLPRSNGLSAGARPDQIALGRGPKDSVCAITRLQPCLTLSGHAGVSASTLVGQSEGQEQSASAALRRLLQLAGISPERHQCLAVSSEN